jgi:hypothetical protein
MQHIMLRVSTHISRHWKSFGAIGLSDIPRWLIISMNLCNVWLHFPIMTWWISEIYFHEKTCVTLSSMIQSSYLENDFNNSLEKNQEYMIVKIYLKAWLLHVRKNRPFRWCDHAKVKLSLFHMLPSNTKNMLRLFSSFYA